MMLISNRNSVAAVRARRARLFGILCLLVVLGLAALWRAPLESAVLQLLSPVLGARHATPGADALAASTTAALAERDALAAENAELKRLLGRDPGVPRVLAGVLLRPPATPYDSLLIDAGTTDGVMVGDAVVAGGNTLIGEVSEVYAHAARVLLYSAPGNTYEAILHIQGGQTIAVAVEGQGGGSLRAQVPAGTRVVVGNVATLPGVLGGYTARVSHIERGESDSFATVYFSVPINASALHFVEVRKAPSYDSH